MASKTTKETTQKDQAKFFRRCAYRMDEKDGCGTLGQGCALTLNMLRQSEIPKDEFGIDLFGKTYPPTGDWKRPETSECTADKIWN